MQIGTYEILPVIDGEIRLRPTLAYTGTTDDDWAPHRALLDADGRLPVTLGGFLLRGGPDRRVVLIDAGLGHHELFPGRRPGGKLLESLAAHGVAAADITDVVFSHLHLDHIGWATEAGEPVFANAAHRCDQRDWDYWMETPLDQIHSNVPDMPAAQREVLAPLADRMQTWSADGPLLPGLDVLHAPGHTPGSAILVVSGGDARALLLGDVVHCPVELLDDEWGGLGDVDPALAKRTRNALARELEGTDTPVAAAHFPGLIFGRLLAAEGRRRWVV